MKTEFASVAPGSSNNPPRVRRDRSRPVVLVGLLLLIGALVFVVRPLSHRSPTIDILGSYFPAWMICIVSGLTLTLVAHWIVQMCRLKRYLGPAPLVYSCLTIIFTFATWILFIKTKMHQAARSSDENVAGVTPSADEAVEGRKFIRKITSLIIVAGAVLITLYVWGIIERHPRTDDATARANVVGIAPRVAGQILKLNVQDNQAVKEGEVLFEIDPEDYKLVLEKAKADLAALDRQIAQAGSSLQRLEPLLPKKFTTAENVDEARTKLTTLQAQREGVVATINLEGLHLSYCKVIAPFSGRVINLNISAGAHVTTGVPVFSLLDTSKWYVMGNFREAELRHMAPGSPATVYLVSAPNQRFRGKVQGIGWAVKSEGEIDLPPSGVPYVKRELNWVRVAQRFPVRIEVENPDPNLFRMGASAVAIIDGPPDR